MKRVLLSWSGGKDSAWALHVLRRSPGYKIMGLLTTINQKFDRIAMHAVRIDIDGPSYRHHLAEERAKRTRSNKPTK